MSLRIGVLCHDSVGGSARIALDMSVNLARRGHEVHLFARRPPLGVDEHPVGVFLHTLEPGGEGRPLTPRLDVHWPAADIERLARRVTSVARAVQLDVLHSHYAVPFVAVADLAARRLGATAPALVVTLHGTDVSLLGRHRTTRDLLHATLPSLDAVTTVSASHAALAARTFRLAGAPLVIPNFVDLRRFRPSRRRHLARGRPRVVHVSNFRPVKQPLAMARTFRAARREVDAELWLIGDGEGLPSALSLLERSGLGGDVRMFGLRLDVERILPDADVMLVTSRTESFCMAALEAAACGIPVVAPAVGGLPETVLHGRTGELYEPGDEAGAAAALARLLGDAALRCVMGEAALSHARRLSSAIVVSSYDRLYRDLLAGREGRVDAEAAPAA